MAVRTVHHLVCDNCGASESFEGNHTPETARNHASNINLVHQSNRQWQCDDLGDYCPKCKDVVRKLAEGLRKRIKSVEAGRA